MLDGVAGVIPIREGTVALGGEPVHRLGRDRRASRELAYVEQGRSIFAGLTVEENLAVVTRGARTTSRAYEMFPELAERRGTTAQMLSGGEQQMLVLARAILCEPKVLLIDEMLRVWHGDRQAADAVRPDGGTERDRGPARRAVRILARSRSAATRTS